MAIAKQNVIAVLTVVVSVSLHSVGVSSNIEPGHTAIWYDPGRDGEGWILEILGDNRAAAYWFTYDEVGNQRWLIGAGQVIKDIDGSRIEFPELLIASGGKFGENFDPKSVVLQNVGSAIFTFDDCISGQVEIQALGYEDTVSLKRITRTMGAGCSPINGIPGEPILGFAGESGSWFDPTHTGEGFPIQWLANGQLVAYWFTYDEAGNQAWMFGVGERQENGEVLFSEVLKPEGARFGTAFDTEDIVFNTWGEFSMDLSCDSGIVSYESSIAAFGAGQQILQPLTRTVQPSCPYQKPKLTDLYELSWEVVPIGLDDMGAPRDIRARSISDQGEIIAHDVNKPGAAEAVLWRPESQSWTTLDDLVVNISSLLRISPNGTRVVANRTVDNSVIPEIPFMPFLWQEDTGWQQLETQVFESGVSFGVSDDRRVLVGTGDIGFGTGKFPWVWHVETGVVELPETEVLAFTTPFGVSNDGRVVVGDNQFIVEGTTTLAASAVRWVDGGEPEELYDDRGTLLASVRLCNEDCSILAGVGQAEFAFDHPNWTESWLWIEGKTFYLGGFDDETREVVTADFAPTAMSADGSIMVGRFLEEIEPGLGLGAPLPFIWTQRTGYIDLLPLLDEMNVEDFDWDKVETISISSSGKKILLVGETGTAFVDKRRHAAVLTLNAIAEVE